jgi:heptosyltransferase-2
MPRVRILVVAPNWIGDALLARPLLARLHRRLPGVGIDALAPPWTAPVMKRMPEITEVIPANFRHGELRLKDRWYLGRSLKGRYDEAVVLPNTFKSALIPFFADIRLRVGFVGESRYGLLNVVHKLDEKKLPLMAERYAQLAEKPGEEVVRPLEPVRLLVDEANLLITLGRLGLDRAKPVAVFCPGAEYGPAKRWPARHFAALAQRLAARGRTVWLIGSDKDREVGAEIEALSEGAALNLCGRTDLASAIDLISAAEVVVSNDSGLMHVAAALGRPLVALYGSSDSSHTPPLAPPEVQARIVEIKGLECRPCFQRVCPLGHFRCMNEITPERVLGDIAAIDSVFVAGIR